MEAFRWAAEKTGQAFEMGEADESHTSGTCALGSHGRRHDAAEQLAAHHQLHHREKAIAYSVFLQRSPRHPPLRGLGSAATHNRLERADWKFSLVYVCTFILLLLRSHFQRLSDRFSSS